MLSSSPGRQADANMQGFSSEILESKKKTTIKKRKETLDKYEMPAHWRPIHPSERFGKLRQAAFSLFCLTAHGHFDLEDFWAVIRLEQEEGDESGWTEELRKLIERMNGMLVVASLLLATSSVFITTEPPRASVVNYTLRGPYYCFFGSFGLLLGGIIVASSITLVLGQITPEWAEHVLYSSRARMFWGLIMLSYPFFSIGIATLLLAFGILTSAWCAEDPGMKSAAVALLVLPISMALVFSVLWGTAGHPPGKDVKNSL